MNLFLENTVYMFSEYSWSLDVLNTEPVMARQWTLNWAMQVSFP